MAHGVVVITNKIVYPFYSLLVYTARTTKSEATKIENKKSQSSLGRAVSPPLMAENKYTTKSLLVTVGCPIFTLKTAPSHRRSIYPSNTPIPRPTPLTTPNGILIQSAVLPLYTFGTHTQTDGLGGMSAPLAMLIESDALTITFTLTSITLEMTAHNRELRKNG